LKSPKDSSLVRSSRVLVIINLLFLSSIIKLVELVELELLVLLGVIILSSSTSLARLESSLSLLPSTVILISEKLAKFKTFVSNFSTTGVGLIISANFKSVGGALNVFIARCNSSTNIYF
jgi:hypothetical protein